MNGIKNTYINSLFDWMDKNFTGDMDNIVVKATEYIEEKGQASGVLWDEMKNRIIRLLYTEHIRNKRDYGASTSAVKSHTHTDAPYQPRTRGKGETMRRLDDQCSSELSLPPSVFLQWHCVSGKWIQLGDMSKTDCITLAQEYEDRAKANLTEGQFFKNLASRMKENQLVKDTFTEQEIVGLKLHSGNP